MLDILLTPGEMYDESKKKFYTPGPIIIKLEHSLLSISKWESIWEKPFFSVKKNENKTQSEILSYFRCMLIEDFYEYDINSMLLKQSEDIVKYINSPNTATVISENDKNKSGLGRIVTNEVIYGWMVKLNIPLQPTETWHINRLFTLIKICNESINPPKKMSVAEIRARNQELNDQRRALHNTKG